MKKILFLGGTQQQIPPIKYAKQQGHYCITCDYLPNNPAHRFADEYHNVSTTDEQAVLKLATELRIDAIIAYASDPAAPTAAYVGNRLNLISNPYDSVYILTHKDAFREFLKRNSFNTPKVSGFSFFTSTPSLELFKKSIEESNLNFPLVMKPADSSGSKGVSVAYSIEELPKAFEYAKPYTRSNVIIMEEYVEKEGYQIAGDGFIVDGKLVFRCFANEHFNYDCNSLVPIGESFPYIGSKDIQDKVHNEIQRALTLLDMKHGALNFDMRVDANDNVWIMEIGPRNGGNLIPEVTAYSTGVDMVKYTVDSALGADCSALGMKPTKGYYASYIIHAERDGIIKNFNYKNIKQNIVEQNVSYGIGDKVKKFNGSNETVGSMILKFGNEDEMLYKMDNMKEFFEVELEI